MFRNTAGFEKSKNEKERVENILRASQLKNEYNNPCIKVVHTEQEMSYKCLNDNKYNGNECSLQFANYKACKEFWGRVQSDRRRKGIQPYLPWPEEREKIKCEYLKNKTT